MGTGAWKGYSPCQGHVLGLQVFHGGLERAHHDHPWLWCQPVPRSDLPAVCWTHHLAKRKKANDFVR